jgi:hypothetical protein
MDKEIEELEEYAMMEGTEIGELCGKLLSLVSLSSYASDEFQNSLAREINLQLKNFKENSEIVERTVTETTTYKELEWR